MVKRLPDRDTWRDLMRPALRIIDSLRLNGYGDLDFRFGGGTVLMLRFDHRVSIDIDLFIDDAQALSFISPRLNDFTSSEVGAYQEQANSIKLTLEGGDIDFVASATVMPGEPAGSIEFEGRRIMVDPTPEILAKKMLFRAASFKARDVFDMCTALALDPAAAARAIAATRSAHPALLRRLSALALVDEADLVGDILMTEAGQVHAKTMVATLIAAIPTGETGGADES